MESPENVENVKTIDSNVVTRNTLAKIISLLACTNHAQR
jgi:hypothetical protein